MICMDEPKRIAPEKVDTLARSLQGSLKQRRPRTWLIAIATIGIVLGGLGLLAWWLYDPTEPVRLEVIAFDSIVAADETPRMRAQLVFPDSAEHAASLLRGRDVVFLDPKGLLLPGQAGLQKSATSDAAGRAEVAWPLPDDNKGGAVTVRHVDARHKQGSADQSFLFLWERGRKILLVDLDEVLAEVAPVPMAPGLPDKILPAVQALQEVAAGQVQVGYLAVAPDRPLTYRIQRGWLRSARAEKDRFPVGPVLGRPEYSATMDADQARIALLKDLKARFGDNVMLIAGDAATVRQTRAAGLHVITVGAGKLDGPPGASDLARWAELPRYLNP
jgi:hypothetical protein